MTLNKHCLQLVDTTTGHTVAKAHNAREGKRKMHIEYEPELTPMLDMVVLSFVICEGNRRRAWDNLYSIINSIATILGV